MSAFSLFMTAPQMDTHRFVFLAHFKHNSVAAEAAYDWVGNGKAHDAPAVSARVYYFFRGRAGDRSATRFRRQRRRRVLVAAWG